METPWKVVGYEKFKSEKGEDCTRLYVARPLVCPEGNIGDGLETQRLFFKPEYVKYEPVIGHMIIATAGRYPGSIGQIFVVGMDKPNG